MNRAYHTYSNHQRFCSKHCLCCSNNGIGIITVGRAIKVYHCRGIIGNMVDTMFHGVNIVAYNGFNKVFKKRAISFAQKNFITNKNQPGTIHFICPSRLQKSLVNVKTESFVPHILTCTLDGGMTMGVCAASIILLIMSLLIGMSLSRRMHLRFCASDRNCV